jgi:transposase
MTKKSTRKRYRDEFKTEALNLARKVGVAAAASQLGIHDAQIYQWRAAADKKASSSRTSLLPAQTRNTWEISPVSGLMKAGCTWLW